MWTTNRQRALFTMANRHNSTGDFKEALVLSDQLLQMLKSDSVQAAYVLGCRKAVALRHLGKPDEAEEAFGQADKIATAAKAWAIVAYIRNDWASMRSIAEAAGMIKEAIELLSQAEREGQGTPDDERAIPADRAYFKATLARTQIETDSRATMAAAKRTLKRHAYGSHPRYRHAYLLVMQWELELPDQPTLLGFGRQVGHSIWAALEALRQLKFKVAIGILALGILGRR